MIQKLLLGVLAVGVIASIGVLSVRHYHEYKNKHPQPEMVSRAVADQTVADTQKAAASEYKSLVVDYNSAVAECQKGAGAYALLPAATKAKLPAPTCPAPVQ